MPYNDDIYDYHEHNDDHIKRAGGVVYHAGVIARNDDRPWDRDDSDLDGQLASLAALSHGGYDVSIRTT